MRSYTLASRSVTSGVILGRGLLRSTIGGRARSSEAPGDTRADVAFGGSKLSVENWADGWWRKGTSAVDSMSQKSKCTFFDETLDCFCRSWRGSVRPPPKLVPIMRGRYFAKKGLVAGRDATICNCWSAG
jgi:hypothetical protein